MRKSKKNRSFATRLSRWVLLVLFIMMCALAFFMYSITKVLVVEIGANTVKGSMHATEEQIKGVLSETSVAVKNNIFYIEQNLSDPDKMQASVERIVRENDFIRSCGISFVKNYYPQKGPGYCPYAWRTDSMQVKTHQLTDLNFDYLHSEWFTKAIKVDSAYWGAPFIDGHDSKTPLIAYLHPLHDKQGRLAAILGADISLDFMATILDKQDSVFQEELWVWEGDHDASLSRKASESYILSRDGIFLTHPESWRIMKGNFYRHLKDCDDEGLAEQSIKNMKEGKHSSNEIYEDLKINATHSFLFYSPVEGTNWNLAVVVPRIALDLLGLTMGVALLFIIVIILMVTNFVCRLGIRRTTKPLMNLAETADKVAQGQFDTALPTIKHQDEIHQLRDSFENMQHSLARYVEDLKTTTAAKASIENELEIAHGIQMSMLPKKYPAFPDRTDVDVYGQVTPAKAVGGDLYDFFIHDEKLFFCIGDVSGKGIPASLVMAVTCSLFRNIAAHTTKPEIIVTGLNEALCTNNETNMFVTVFAGVLDLKTGHLSYSNAGHDMPLLLDANGVTILSCDPNVPIGVCDDWTFTCQQLDLKEGATLFLYTDGLNEAEDVRHNQFGMKRMLDVANGASSRPEELVNTMKQAVEQFVGGADQSDDLTMFVIQYLKSSTPNN